jgi:hypothetical protein
MEKNYTTLQLFALTKKDQIHLNRSKRSTNKITTENTDKDHPKSNLQAQTTHP